jgi:hypothetical protein
MRQMPGGQWVAFEDDAAYKCAAPPKAKPVRKPPPRQVSPLPPPPVDDEFGEFVLPNGKPITVEKPPAATGIDTPKAPTPSTPVQCPVPVLPPASRLPVGTAIVRPDPRPPTPAPPRAEPVHPVPSPPSQGFRQWLVRVLAFMLILGLVKAVLRETTRPNPPQIDYTTPSRNEARPDPAGQTSPSPSIKILQTRPVSYPQTAPAPPAPTPPGPYPTWWTDVMLPRYAKP